MEDTPNCKKCIHCQFDEQWKEYICMTTKYTISDINQLAVCKKYEERSEE